MESARRRWVLEKKGRQGERASTSDEAERPSCGQGWLLTDLRLVGDSV